MYTTARIVPLAGNTAMIPMTPELFDEMTLPFASRDKSIAVSGFMFLTSVVAEILKTASRGGPIAYIETEYFGGVGTQGAAAWSAGDSVLSPEINEHGEPINRALRKLGIEKGSKFDEFDAIGLGRYRSMDDLPVA